MFSGWLRAASAEPFHRQRKADCEGQGAERQADVAEQRRRRNYDIRRLERGVGIVQFRHHGQHRNGKHHEEAEKQRRAHQAESDALEDGDRPFILVRDGEYEYLVPSTQYRVKPNCLVALSTRY